MELKGIRRILDIYETKTMEKQIEYTETVYEMIRQQLKEKI